MAYYPDWAAPAFPPEKIDFGRFDWIDYAFAVPDENFNLTWDGSDDAPNLLARLVSAAHGKGKNVKLSVGGWTGSKFFSPAVSSEQSRQTFVANILDVYKHPNDTANFLAFLQLLRATLPPTAKITAATLTVPFADDAGNPLADASAFAQVLDWVLLMNYDAWGSSSSPGPNAPLSDGCYNSTQDSANAFSAMQAWTAAGFPASKLVLGVPSYGYISRSSATLLRSRSHAPPRTRRSRHARWRRLSLLQWTDALVPAPGPLLPPPVLATSEDGGTDSGQVQFSELVQQGVLQSTPDAARTIVQGTELHSLYAGWSGFTRYWDACSSTPYLRSAAAGQVVTYDDPMSLGMKAVFAREAGMRGVNMFDVHGDTDAWDLTDALRRGLGVIWRIDWLGDGGAGANVHFWAFSCRCGRECRILRKFDN
ncbi:Chitinase-3-like protein 2 [Grifola frondosa]|uniref:Chitinase-3-like protein 2 n=1 Tax=Grifola frondosa TaxID=5627 RepID=A0A1C7M0W0_GRIFR|nr:Chitinase-3-like protein 2 [Grifola frondosa]